MIDLYEFREAFEELHHLGVVVRGSAPTKNHGRRQRIGISTDVLQAAVWSHEHIAKHLLVLEELVGNVRLGYRDVEQGVGHFAKVAPCRTVFLQEVSTRLSNGRSRIPSLRSADLRCRAPVLYTCLDGQNIWRCVCRGDP